MITANFSRNMHSYAISVNKHKFILYFVKCYLPKLGFRFIYLYHNRS